MIKDYYGDKKTPKQFSKDLISNILSRMDFWDELVDKKVFERMTEREKKMITEQADKLVKRISKNFNL